MAQRVTFYIDGFNFYYGLKRTKSIDPDWKAFYWIDFVKLFSQFLGKDQVLEKVIYFTASPLDPNKTTALIEKDEHGYGIFTPDLKSTIIGEGKSVEEAKADFLNSYSEVIASYKENGETVPEELVDLEFAYKYDIASLFNEFNFINATKFAQWIGISPSLMRHYKAGDTYISEAQAKKIEEGLHKVAEGLLQVAL